MTKAHPEINPYTRPGIPILEHKGMIIHWTATPRATAQNIADAFNRNIKNKEFASAQYIIGIDGEVLEYVPPDEVAYQGGTYAKYYTPAAKHLWYDRGPTMDWKDQKINIHHPYFYLIGVETCHEDIEGKFSISAIESLIELIIAMWMRWDMGDMMTHIYRHSDLTGKGLLGRKGELPCPRYFIDNPMSWDKWRLNTKERYIQRLREMQERGETITS